MGWVTPTYMSQNDPHYALINCEVRAMGENVLLSDFEPLLGLSQTDTNARPEQIPIPLHCFARTVCRCP